MNTQIARLISIIFHPLLIPTWIGLMGVTFLPDFFPYTEKVRLNIILLVFLATFLIPIFPIFLFFRKNLTERLSNPDYKDRLILLTFCTFVYVAIFYWFSYVGLRDGFISAVIASCVIASWTATLINIFYKISLHTISMGVFVGIFCLVQFYGNDFNLLYEMIALLLLSGFVASSRLALGAHNLHELLTGFLIGLIAAFLVLEFMPLV